MKKELKPIIFSIGHSTHKLNDFIELLKSYRIEKVIDVRSIPRSRHNPQFNKTTLPKKLRARGIGYQHLPGLGGLRHTKKDSINLGWQNASFRGFADYMQTKEFTDNIKKLVEMAKKKRLAMMCGEALPWRCHRSLIADTMKIKGIETEHILSKTNSRRHKLTSFAHIKKGKVIYPKA